MIVESRAHPGFFLFYAWQQEVSRQDYVSEPLQVKDGQCIFNIFQVNLKINELIFDYYKCNIYI